MKKKTKPVEKRKTSWKTRMVKIMLFSMIATMVLSSFATLFVAFY